MANPSSGSQINALTATRAIAAIMVFIHHFGIIFPFNRFPAVFHSGNVAVSYFFVLSGFVLYITYHNKDTSYGNYIKKRIGRIVPVYLLALLLTIYVNITYNGTDIHAPRYQHEILLSAFFLQAYIPSYPLVINLPAWTISVEMFFYFLFPLLLLLQKKNTRYFLALTLVLFTLSQYFNLKYYPHRHTLSDNIVDTVFFSPQIHISQFMIGMIGGNIFNRIKDTTHKYSFLPLALFAAIFLSIAFRPANLSYQVGLLAPLFMLFIIVVAVNNPPLLNARPLVFLGEISYGIYILQWPVYGWLDNINTRYMHISKEYFFYFSLAGLIAFASAVYFLLEMPLKKKISNIKF